MPSHQSCQRVSRLFRGSLAGLFLPAGLLQPDVPCLRTGIPEWPSQTLRALDWNGSQLRALLLQTIARTRGTPRGRRFRLAPELPSHAVSVGRVGIAGFRFSSAQSDLQIER